jgi:predicted Zn finger-like uncharacterized protein
LIVTCEKCATQFQLEEARVPESGIRVRCSVCRHAFFVEHPDSPGEPASDPGTRVVEDVLRRVDPLGDESWEFSDGGRLSEAASRGAHDRFEEGFEAAREAVDELLGVGEPTPPPWRASGRELAEPGPEPEPPLERPPAPEPEPPPIDQASRTAPVGDPWRDPSWERRGGEGPGPRAELAAEASEDELELDEGDGALELDPGDAALELDPGDAELGALETDDALGDDLGGFERDPVAREPDPEPAPSAEPLASPAAVLTAGPAAVAPPSLGLGARIELEPLRLEWLGRAGNLLGAAAVSILAAVAFWASAAPRTRSDAAPGAQELAGLEASRIEGRFVEHATLGSLYVVRGELRNPAPAPRPTGARLVVRLLDAEGAPLAAPVASLALPLDPARLREADAEDLRAAREAAARELAAATLAAGASVAFEAVIEELPEAARRFELAVQQGAEGAAPGP